MDGALEQQRVSLYQRLMQVTNTFFPLSCIAFDFSLQMELIIITVIVIIIIIIIIIAIVFFLSSSSSFLYGASACLLAMASPILLN
jgi:hypothetical protein